MSIAVYPGTFDPLTLGHLDVITRASKLFNTVVVAVASSPKKQPLFSLAERIKLIEEVTAVNPKVKVLGFSGLLTEFMQQQQASFLVRGVRGLVDFEYEVQLAQLNRSMQPNLETIFLPPSTNLGFVAATLVREVASLHGDVSQLVPPEVAQALQLKFAASK